MKKNAPYSNHRDQLKNAQPPRARINELTKALEIAFKGHIKYKKVGFILFDQLTAEELAEAFLKYPIIIKAVLASINVAGRAVERDLQISIDTYGDTPNREKMYALAGYIKPSLPKELAITSLISLDNYFWTDKELRAHKGRWEKRVTDNLNKNSNKKFKKRKFKSGSEVYEIDAAHPMEASKGIDIAIDVKRIESPRDIHKRADEIISKAEHFKRVHRKSKFYAVVYYPFPNQHQNVLSRLQHKSIDGIFFAAETESSIKNAARLLLGKAGILK